MTPNFSLQNYAQQGQRRNIAKTNLVQMKPSVAVNSLAKINN
jgi:hypothetical protein